MEGVEKLPNLNDLYEYAIRAYEVLSDSQQIRSI